MNKRWVHISIIVLLALVYFRGVYLRPGEMVYSSDSDLIRFHAPQRSFLVESLKKHGRIPLWNQLRWSGAPYQANQQSMTFYPLVWLLLPVPPDYSYGYYFMVHAVLAGFFMYLYLGEIGLDRFARLLGAVLYMFGGAALYMYLYHNVAFLFPWTALLMFLAERLVRRVRIFYAILLGMVAAIQFLGCHPQYFFFNLCLISCYLAWLVFRRRRGAPRSDVLKICGYLAVSFAVFAALAAVQLLPAIEFSKYCSRRGGLSLYDSSYPLFYPWQIWRCIYIVPGKGPYGGIYFGFGISMLALWGMVLSDRRVKVFFIAFSLICFIYAFGKLSPLFYLCYKFLPPFRYFREPARSLWVFSFSWIVLAALGMDSLLRPGRFDRPPGRSFRLSMRLAICAILVAIPGWLLNTSGGGRLALRCARYLYGLARFSSPFAAHRAAIGDLLSEGTWMGLQLLLFIAASYLLLCLILGRSPSFRRKIVIPLISLAVIAELLFVGCRMQTIRPAELYEETAPLSFINKSRKGRFRVLGMGNPRPLPQVIAQHYGIELVDGYDPSVLDDYLRFTNSAASVEKGGAVTKLPLTDGSVDDIVNNTVLDLLNVRFILSLEPAKEGRYRLCGIFHDVPLYRQFGGIVREPDYYVYENTTALPRAFVVPEARVIRDREELLRRLSDMDPRRVVFLEKESGAAPGVEPFRGIPYSSCLPNEIRLDVSVRHPAYLVLSEIWYPGWKAFDNGREKEVLRMNYLLRGIFLEAGDHTVVFRFQPASYEIGRLVSLAALVVSAGAILISCRKRRK
ncbi:MAG: hypothetical protein P9M00_05675 [Candidatus Tritonobacter lacicola]|nr:hypothetical protein [Candidatus Tritonobacter lacicola]